MQALTEEDMTKKGTKRIEIIKKIIAYGTTEEDIPITKFKENIGITISSVKEYLEIIDYLSQNPVQVIIDEKGRFTFITIKKEEKKNDQ